MSDLKERVDHRMKELGLTYTAVAAKVGISSAYLSDLVMGRRGQNSWERYKPLIADALDLSADDLVHTDGVKEPAA